jgi:nitrite reductase/ring-hydroxylating ferredoxin subunit
MDMPAIARLEDVPPGTTQRFELTCDGRAVPGFVVNVSGRLHAWVNRCRHVPMELDWVENRFFTEDGRWIQCATHGALYEPETGECVAGPPCGKALLRVPIEVRDGEIFAGSPGPLPDDA